jgi:MSS51 C-terminal domain/MYND finger
MSGSQSASDKSEGDAAAKSSVAARGAPPLAADESLGQTDTEIAAMMRWVRSAGQRKFSPGACLFCARGPSTRGIARDPVPGTEVARQKDLKKCSGCLAARYCSPQCAKLAWKSARAYGIWHKDVCGAFARATRWGGDDDSTKNLLMMLHVLRDMLKHHLGEKVDFGALESQFHPIMSGPAQAELRLRIMHLRVYQHALLQCCHPHLPVKIPQQQLQQAEEALSNLIQYTVRTCGFCGRVGGGSIPRTKQIRASRLSPKDQKDLINVFNLLRAPGDADLTPCTKCGSILFCADCVQHMTSVHHEAACEFAVVSSVCEFMLEDNADIPSQFARCHPIARVSSGFPRNWEEYFECVNSPLVREHHRNARLLYWNTYAYTWSVSIASAIDKLLATNRWQPRSSSRLVIHCLGSDHEVHYRANHRVEELFHAVHGHVLPDVTELVVQYVGPNSVPFDAGHVVKQCANCDDDGMRKILRNSRTSYASFVRSSGVAEPNCDLRPDLLVFFHAGLGDGDWALWDDEFQVIADTATLDCPLVAMSYSAHDANREKGYLQNRTAHREIIFSEQNPFRSVRPIREPAWSADDIRIPFFHHADWLTIAMRTGGADQGPEAVVARAASARLTGMVPAFGQNLAQVGQNRAQQGMPTRPIGQEAALQFLQMITGARGGDGADPLNLPPHNRA